jgi:hypothetical protein
MTLYERAKVRTNVAYWLQGLAVVAGARGQTGRCVRLFGVAGALLEAVGSPVYNYHKPDPAPYERTMFAARLFLRLSEHSGQGR